MRRVRKPRWTNEELEHESSMRCISPLIKDQDLKYTWQFCDCDLFGMVSLRDLGDLQGMKFGQIESPGMQTSEFSGGSNQSPKPTEKQCFEKSDEKWIIPSWNYTP